VAAYKFDDLGHFNLSENTTRFIIAKARGVANVECIGPFNRYLPWLTSIKFIHAFHFRKRHKITILKAMSSLVQTCDKTVLVLMSQISTDLNGFRDLNALSTDTIIPVKGCSPVGSTHVNLAPKSLKTEL
jgi:hypothetical protein